MKNKIYSSCFVSNNILAIMRMLKAYSRARKGIIYKNLNILFQVCIFYKFQQINTNCY